MQCDRLSLQETVRFAWYLFIKTDDGVYHVEMLLTAEWVNTRTHTFKAKQSISVASISTQ